MRVLFCYLCLFFSFYSFSFTNKKFSRDQQIQNLIAFSKAYGYIRYFHPIDESRKFNWDKFLLYGIPKIVCCKNDNDLRDSLIQLFKPISPLVSFLPFKPGKNAIQTYKPTDTLIFHQYRGIKTSQFSYLDFKDYPVRICNNSFIDNSLFYLIPNYQENFCKQLNSELFIDFPLVVKVEHNKNFAWDLYKQNGSASYQKITKEQVKTLADVIAFWNIVQHFYPYHTESGMNWEQTLKFIIEKVLNDSHPYDLDKCIFCLERR
jgi:hypothetical protein